MKNILALLADWANGIFAVLLASYLFGMEPAWWYFLIGLVLAMSPDIDALPELLARGRVAASAEYTKDHRTFLHYPIISLPLGLLAWYSFGYWGLVWCSAVLLHLINDLYGTGWGLQLFSPFSRRHYKFFARRANSQPRLLQANSLWDTLDPNEKRLRLVVSWSAEELPKYITHYGVDDWIVHWYLRCNPTMLVEYGLFITALVLMLISLLY
jgi:hypothetical protein